MAPDRCQHWWKLPMPDGPTCEGVCKWCGAVKTFPTASDTSIWDTDGRAGFRQRGYKGMTDAVTEVNTW